MLRKIGLVTLWKRNYGSALQCYATKKTLKKNGYVCELLSEQYASGEKYKIYLKKLFLYIVYAIRYRGFLRNMRALRKASHSSINSLSDKSKKLIDVFCYSELQPRFVSYSVLKDIGWKNDYVAFICGSDQIWSGNMLYDKANFLRFCPQQKRIAFAASFGCNFIEKYNIRNFKKGLNEIPFISVREDCGRILVRKLINKDVPQIPDPTFLLNPLEWKAFSKDGLVPKEKYILLHFIDKPTPLAIQQASVLAKKFNLKIYGFAYPHREYTDDIIFLNGNPKDYVSLIYNAEYVLTDSFHTTLFSLYAQRKFYTYERNYKHNGSQESRKIDLLKKFDCEKRYCPDLQKEFFETGGGANLNAINNERKKCLDYLLQSISALDYQTQSKNNDTLLSLESCCGCRVCELKCPREAISFTVCDYGYKIPQIESQKCIHCGLCVNICKKDSKRVVEKQQAYLGVNVNHELELQSASGGIFSAIANNVILQGGCVYGAKLSFNKGVPSLEHTRITSIEDLPSILKSKYVQSDCFNSYKLIKKDLEDGKKVLFCGTSCQVDALYRFLGQTTTENLITVDLVCHGVPGFEFFEDYCLFVSKKYNKNIVDFSFRTKIRRQNLCEETITYEETITFEDGCVIKIPWLKSPYFRMFLACESYRESCYQCKFANTHKPADITIGDYFEAYQDYADLIKQNETVLGKCSGLSCVVSNNARGQDVLSSIENLCLLPIDINMVKFRHMQLCMPSMYTKMRKKLFKIYEKRGFKGLASYYRMREIFVFIPKRIISFIKS